MSEVSTQEVTEEKLLTGKTVISFKKPTPMWATWIFRAVFFLTTALSIWVVATGLIKDEVKGEIMLAFKCFDVVIWGLSKGVGIEKQQFES